MNSPAPLPVHRVDHTPSHQPDPKLRIGPTEADQLPSPLWAVAIGTAFLFVAMAAVMAFG
jgi:hypothetical protein